MVGSVLYLTARVAYTEPLLIETDKNDGQAKSAENTTSGSDNKKSTRVQIRVDSKVRDVEHGVAKPTGQFNYTFLVEKDVKVMPQSYEEFMIWVDARRRAARSSGVSATTQQ